MCAFGFTKSPEAVQEWQKLNRPYDEEFQDLAYTTWLNETDASNLSSYTHHKEKEITSITIRVVETGEYDNKGNKKTDQNAWITYDFIHRRLDRAANVTSRTVPKNGMYPIPHPHFRVKSVSFGKEEREVDFIEGYETAYSIPYTKQNLLKLIKEIPLSKEGVQCAIAVSNGIRVHVNSFDDLLNAKDYRELLPNQQKIEEVVKARTLQNIPERPVTASEVQEMLKQEKRQNKD